MKKILCLTALSLVAGLPALRAEEAAKPAAPPSDAVRRTAGQLDRDGDGKITVEEYKAMAGERAKTRFERADTNKDGKVTEAEMDAIRGLMAARTTDANPARPALPKFAELDSNKDGVVTLEEYSGPLQAKAAERAKELDKDGDGVLSREEMPTPPSPPAPPAGTPPPAAP